MENGLEAELYNRPLILSNRAKYSEMSCKIGEKVV